MKKMITTLIFFLVFITYLFSAEVEVLLKIPSMTWPGKVYGVSSTLENLDGVKEVNTSMSKKEVFIKYDNSEITLKEMIKALKDSGYKVDGVKKIQ